MRAKAGILIFISFLLMVGTVGAAVGIPDKIVVTTDKPWIVANNVDQSTITVTVTNSTPGYSGPIQGVTVNLSVNNTIYGNLSPTQVTSDLYGMASSTFKVKTKSGAAQIIATITSTGLPNSTIQNIDHASAYYTDFTHPLSGTVASPVTFNVSLTDQYRNPIDNRTGNHIISLHVSGPAPDDCGFAEAGYAHDIFPTLDANGNTSVIVKLTSRTGDNNIAMDGYESIPNQLKWITAEANGVPFSITQDYSPSGSPPTLPADGVSYFTIIYKLFDEYGNPTNKQYLWVNTSISGEEKQFTSNYLGQVMYPYGPRSSIGEIYITATAVANSTVTTGPQMVKFKNTGAEIISLTANPDIMASRDVPPSTSVSNIIATVADISGNAVPGEMVNFTLVNETYDATYNVTTHPSLLSSSGITDAYGKATVQFIPGNFTTAGNPGYNASATGHCNVIATWNGTQKTVPVTWKNYPYLSVSTSVTPLTVGINQTINVTIQLKGDGWALGPRPVDVVIVTNLAGGVGGAERLTQTKVGEVAFVESAESGVFISLVSIGNNPTYTSDKSGKGGAGPFASANALALWNQQQIDGLPHFQPYDGAPMDKCLWDPALWNSPSRSMPNATICPGTAYNYFNPSSDAKLEMDFIQANSAENKKLLKDKVQDFNDFGGTNYAGGINMALRQFDKVKNNGHVKALIIMGDGITMVAPTAPGATDSYWPSDWYPRASLGCFDESDSAKIAAWKAADLAKSQGIEIFVLGYPSYGQIDNQTINGIVSPGRYYFVPDANQMRHYFDVIYGEIREEAGVNTNMMVDFQSINVTNVPTQGSEVYDYVYHPTASTKIGWQDGKTNVTDQSADWLDNKLDFSIGTIKIQQQWNATFRLKIKKSGIIDVFGKNSTVSFNGITDPLILPQTFITVVPELIITEITAKTISLNNLTVTETGEIKALLPVRWNTNYTGNKTLTEKVYYRIDTGPWIQFDTKTHTYDPLITEYINYAQLDVRNLPPGNFKIKVYATASDAPDAVTETGYKPVGGQGKTFIKLKAPPFEYFGYQESGIVTQYFYQKGQNPLGMLHDLIV